MMLICGLDEGFVWLAEVTSTCGQASIDATRCERIPPPGLGGIGVVAIQPSDSGGSSKRTREILRESEERFRLLVEGVKDYAIFMLDVEGRVSTWNSGPGALRGTSRRRS
jgi:PAS domain-containing protein